MRVAIFSDVHGNLPALEAFVRATRGTADAYLCLGDVVGYGPWSDECLELVHGLPGITLLEGNHERLFLGLDSIAAQRPLVRQFHAQALRWFTRPDLIAGLPTATRLGSFACSHTIGGRNIYADTPVEIDRSHVIGHTHHQFAVSRAGRLLVNCGSVGQDRGTIDRYCYALYDAESDAITLHHGGYAFQRFVGELVARGYPPPCLDYYLSKPRAPPERQEKP